MAAAESIFCTLHDAALIALISAAACVTRTASEDIELDESIDAETSTSLTPLHETDESEVIADATLLIAIALDVIDDELSTFAAASTIPPPIRVEKGDCENALNPNIYIYLLWKFNPRQCVFIPVINFSISWT